MSSKILTFGSLNIDYVYSVDHFVQKGETLASGELEIFSGGKGLNQSVALGRAGAEVFHAGAVGPDGQFLLDLLQEAGVDTHLVKRLESVRTGNAIIQRDPEGNNCILLYGGANQAITREQVKESLEGFGAGDYIVLQNEINQMPFLMEQAHAKGMHIVLNPSPMNGRIFEMPLGCVDYLILNEVEAAQILEADTPALGDEKAALGDEKAGEAMAELLKKKFPRSRIVLTLGENGSVYCGEETRIRQPAYAVRAVDTTAAGDTFTGYFIAGISRGMSAEEALDTASRAAAIAVTKPGAAPSIPAWEQVQDWNPTPAAAPAIH